jgi:hypothetical protein
MDMDERQAMNEVVATQPSDSGQSTAASDELDFASEVRQQLTEVRQQMSQQNSEVRQQLAEVSQQNSELRQQMSQQNSEVRQQILKMVQQNSEVTQQVSLLSQMFHSVQSAQMLQFEHQLKKSKEQHRYSVSATDMQQAKTTERHALTDDTCQSVQVFDAAAGIGAPKHADDKTEQHAAMPYQISHDTAVPHLVSTMQSAVEQTRIADKLLLERLEQLANSNRLFYIAEYNTCFCKLFYCRKV